METKTKILVGGGILLILMSPALFLGVKAYFVIVISLAVIVGGLFGFVTLYRKLFKEWA
ncbi:MAG: hypothetical protein NTY03_04300 [Candidatus Bathyarchaeota archaeon]|nr:hypothetical protein [Candidatus Bathyarchaeota archaeon]